MEPNGSNLPEISCTTGYVININTAANNVDRDVNKIDSTRNWLMSACLKAPETFRIPTSFDRSMERAVDRFIKFIHAISSIKIAMTENMYMFDRLPVVPGWRPAFQYK